MPAAIRQNVQRETRSFETREFLVQFTIERIPGICIAVSHGHAITHRHTWSITIRYALLPRKLLFFIAMKRIVFRMSRVQMFHTLVQIGQQQWLGHYII